MVAFDAEDEVASRDKTVVHVLESVVVNWIRQVKVRVDWLEEGKR